MMNLEDVIINSGHRSGEKIPDMTTVFDPPVIKGTDKLYNVQVDRVDRPITKYTIGRKRPNAGSSNVIGTRKSFNAGMESVNAGRGTGLQKVPGNSFYNPKFDDKDEPGQPSLIRNVNLLRKKSNTSVNYEGRSKQHGNAGTQFSFNVLGEGSHIDMEGATINSGYCSGYGIKYHSDVSDCNGTDKSFNAKSGGQILLKDAAVCSGGYADGISAAKNNKK